MIEHEAVGGGVGGGDIAAALGGVALGLVEAEGRRIAGVLETGFGLGDQGHRAADDIGGQEADIERDVEVGDGAAGEYGERAGTDEEIAVIHRAVGEVDADDRREGQAGDHVEAAAEFEIERIGLDSEVEVEAGGEGQGQIEVEADLVGRIDDADGIDRQFERPDYGVEAGLQERREGG